MIRNTLTMLLHLRLKCNMHKFPVLEFFQYFKAWKFLKKKEGRCKSLNLTLISRWDGVREDIKSFGLSWVHRTVTNRVNKKATKRASVSAHFGLPWLSPCPWGNRGKCYMDEKRIQCWSNASQHVPIYLQSTDWRPAYINNVLSMTDAR